MLTRCFSVFPANCDVHAVGSAIAFCTASMKSHDKGMQVPDRKYVNYFEVGHNPFEFYVDFGQYDPNSEKVQMHTRIVTSPAYAKMMGKTLSSSVGNFEREHGTIPANANEIDAMEMVRESLRRTETKP
jgi:hypothetical protein